MNVNILKFALAAIILAFGLYIFIYPPSQTKTPAIQTCPDYSSLSISKLPISLLDEMSGNYKSKQLVHINREMVMPPHGDARAIRFDLQTLKIFISKVESLALQNGYQNINTLGIRIYYASYPDEGVMRSNVNLNSLPANYGGLHTLFAVPTINKGGVDTDFDPSQPNSYIGLFRKEESYPIDPNQIMPALLITNQAINSNRNQNNAAQNHGDLYPPFGAAGLAF